MLTDIHTHKSAPYPEGVIACSPEKLPAQEAFPGQLYSVGIHPWDVRGMGLSPAEKERMKEAASRSDVVAIGECGIDMVHEGAAPLFSQMLAFKSQVELSEATGKPLILHCVKVWDIIIGVRKDLGARQPWLVHGFRGKPSVLKMLLDAGIEVSFGEKYNTESLAAIPAGGIITETDASKLSIVEIIENMRKECPGQADSFTEEAIDAAIRRFLGNRKQETGNRKQETVDRRQETGNRRQGIGESEYK